MVIFFCILMRGFVGYMGIIVEVARLRSRSVDNQFVSHI